jgi:hypothetical protein
MTTVLYLGVSSLLLAFFGAGPARALLARHGAPVAAIAGLSYGIGALLLTLEALVFSALGVPWTVAGLSAPLLVLSVWLIWRTENGLSPSPLSSPAARSRLPRAMAGAVVVGLLAAGVLAVGLLNSSADSVDFVLFYGVKALLFAKARAIPPWLLSHSLFAHAAPRYPPLMPLVESWGVLLAGELPWRFRPLISLVWYVAAVAAIGSRLRRRLGAHFGGAAAAYWASALALSLAFSYSGGNGEAPLVYFLSIAGAWLLTESPGESRLLPACLLAGAALTKQEGLLAALALAAGTAVRDAVQRRPRAFARGALAAGLPVAAVLVWFGWEWISGLPVGYTPPAPVSQLDLRLLPEIAPDVFRNLDAGTRGLSWVLPIALLLFVRPRQGRLALLPAAAAAAAIGAALLATYLSPVSIGRFDLIGRTMPRACQPVLSLLILAAAVRVAGPAQADAGEDIASHEIPQNV